MKASEIADGDGHAFMVGRIPVAVARVAGELVVLRNECKHMGCETDFSDEISGWECPCHGSRYHANGDLMRGPAERGLDRLPFHVTDDEIVLD